MKYFIALLFIFQLSAEEEKVVVPKIINLGGPFLGERVAMVKLKAFDNKMRLKGLKTRSIDPVNAIQADPFVVKDGKNFMKNKDVKQQTFFFMNEKMVACELLFKSSDGMDKYRKVLTKSGFKTTGEKKVYTAKIDRGSFKGLPIKVLIETRMLEDKKKVKTQIFVALIICHKVLGANFSEESIIKSQGKNRAEDDKVDKAVGRAL